MALYESAPGYRWFHGPVTRDQADTLLQRVPIENAFFVRQDSDGGYVLVLKLPGSVRHCRIRQIPNGQYQLDGAPHAFPDMNGVVTDYKNVMQLTPIGPDGMAVEMLTPAAPMPSAPLMAPYPPTNPPYPPTNPPYPPSNGVAPVPNAPPAEAPPSYNDIVKPQQPVSVPSVAMQAAPTAAPPPQPSVHWSVPSIQAAEPESGCTCDSCIHCMCACDTDNYHWYDLRGKGFFIIILLIIGYIIGGIVFLAFAILMCGGLLSCGGGDDC